VHTEEAVPSTLTAKAGDGRNAETDGSGTTGTIASAAGPVTRPEAFFPADPEERRCVGDCAPKKQTAKELLKKANRPKGRDAKPGD
jgi:hypothetical protein